MNITIPELIEVIEASTKSMEVHVDSKDYYARPGDVTNDVITYVCPYTFKQQLEELMRVAQG